MSSFSYSARSLARPILGAFLALAMVFSSIGTLLAAGTTGGISGIVTDAKTGLPQAGVIVAAVSPTTRAKATTDAKGFFGFTGLTPDTYTVSFTLQGFETAAVTGVNVFPDNVTPLDQKISKSLVVIARTTTHSVAGAFQPTQTNDSYTVTSDQIQTIQGKDNNTDEVSILTSLPGASLDSSGYPVLRGGRENEEGYQFEGIDIVDSFSNQFTNSLSVNGIKNFQLTPGAGNATNGNAGTGSINYTAKRGEYPGFGSVEADVNSYPYQHQLSFEYGVAAPDGHISNYFSFIGQRDGAQVGNPGVRAVDIGQFNGVGAFSEDNIVDNFIYKFGKNKDTELQLLYQNQIDYFQESYGGSNGLLGILADPYSNEVNSLPSLVTQYLGLSPAEVASTLQALPGHPNYAPYGKDAQYQPQSLYKVQLSHNFGSSAFLRAAYFGVNAVTLFDLPDPSEGIYEGQGSLKHGLTLDFTDQLNRKNLLQVGTKYAYNHPVFFNDNQQSNVEAVGLGLGGILGLGAGQGFELADFLPSNNPDCNTLLGELSLTYPAGKTPTCGYINSINPNLKLPLYDRTASVDRADYSAYINDQYTANDHLKIEGGLRLDANDTKFPHYVDQYSFAVPDDAQYPKEFQPRLAVSFQATKNDAFRASFARSTEFPPLADLARIINPTQFTSFDNIPSFNVLTGLPATYCGYKQNQACTSYGQQLYSEYQAIAGTPIQPIKPETFTSYDASYSHQFRDNIAVKVTPFFTRGFDIVDRVSNVTGVDPATNRPIFGPAIATNDGVEKTSGVEFLLTREQQYGFSGQLSATYLNKLSNVPPLSTSEDFFPTIPSASLALGDLYRVGYLSPFQSTLAVQYKTRGGLRINPQITYNKGYPYNNGLTTATYINGVPYNIPLTDVTGPLVGSNPSQFVDPANPGSVFKPNVDATLGTPETRDTGGLLSHAQFFTNLTIELSPPGTRSTFGIAFNNVFNQIYSLPFLNTSLQPVATGVLGPQSGKLQSYAYPYTLAPYNTPYLAATPISEGGQLPYSIFQANQPFSALFYYELKL